MVLTLYICFIWDSQIKGAINERNEKKKAMGARTNASQIHQGENREPNQGEGSSASVAQGNEQGSRNNASFSRNPGLAVIQLAPIQEENPQSPEEEEKEQKEEEEEKSVSQHNHPLPLFSPEQSNSKSEEVEPNPAFLDPKEESKGVLRTEIYPKDCEEGPRIIMEHSAKFGTRIKSTAFSYNTGIQ